MTVAELIEKLKEVDPNALVHVGVFVTKTYGFEYESGVLDEIYVESGSIYLDSTEQ